MASDYEDGWSADLAPELDSLAMPSVAELARRLVGARRASLLLPLADSEYLYIAESAGLPREFDVERRIRLGDPIAGQVAQTGRLAYGNARHPHAGQSAAGYRTGTYISVPILTGEGAFGVFNVADPVDGGGFSATDLGALRALARYVARDLAGTRAERRLIQSQENERRRIALNLHDDVGHMLTAAIFRIDRDRAQLPVEESHARDALERAREQLAACADVLHDIARELRPQVLDDLGLVAALRSLVRRMPESGGPPTTLTTLGAPYGPDADTELVVYRVAQEALTNIRKHARATRATVSLVYGVRDITLLVEDNGVGLDERRREPPARGGLGISGMRERVESCGGRLAITERAGGGTRLAARLPVLLQRL